MLEPGNCRAPVREIDHDLDDFRGEFVQETGFQVLLCAVREYYYALAPYMAGLIFAFNLNRLPGSYLFLSSTSRG